MNGQTILLVAFLVFGAWSIPFLFRPVLRHFTRREPIRLVPTLLLFFLAGSVVEWIWFDPDSTASLIFYVTLSPLFPFTIVAYASFAYFDYGFHASTLLGLALGIVGLVAVIRSKGTKRLLLALVVPMLAISSPVILQARLSEAQMMARYNELEADCLDARGFIESLRYPHIRYFWPYHAVARRGDQYFNWSYRQGAWEEIPKSESRKEREYAPTKRCQKQ